MTVGDEWGTPDGILEAARKVLGRIDLDPASNDTAQSRVKAKAFHTILDDGLKHNWRKKRVWLNPPYSRPAPFVEKMAAECNHGILLTNVSASTRWFHTALNWCDCICIWRRRVAFLDDKGTPKKGNRYDSIAFYRGPRQEKFSKVFSGFGAINYCASNEITDSRQST